ncbi:tRNA (N(6)-L-threonylcarbamoyladenosine(37)-C(2))-methylthiotransferase [Candidatus Woesearchaeota archaeon]|nr:tRNA (N(6)-L-threonylcarbamoyladenosine(37)-C(2))-methylthiotransferase [Candidatus Woesearchaeota archaeon]
MTKIYFITRGCAVNRSDSEIMAGLLEQSGFEITRKIGSADVIIFNTCTVKSPTESSFFSKLKELEKKYPNKKIIVTGCIAQTAPEKLEGYSLLGTTQIHNIVEVVEETINNNTVELLVKEKKDKASLPHIRNNPVVEIIQICEGCLGHCTYCKVKQARGELNSFPKEDIVKHARRAVIKGAKELWLTAQDTGCYGKDMGSSLPELLKELINIPGNFRIRLGMLNPNHALEFLDELIDVYKSEKMFKFIHLPLQSGNDDILKAMERKYSAEDFKTIIKKIREKHPNMTIATDVIAGFPSETEQQFNDTLNLIKELTPDVINISRFWKRSKTKAAKMKKQVHNLERKRRSTLLTDIYHNIARMRNERWLNWKGIVLIDEKNKDGSWTARNFAYKPVILNRDLQLGEQVDVKIIKTTSFDLIAEQI